MKITAGETIAYTVIKQAGTPAYPDNIPQARRLRPMYSLTTDYYEHLPSCAKHAGIAYP